MGNIQKSGVANIKAFLASDSIKARFQEVLGRRAAQFMSSIISAASSNAELANCEPMTVIQAALKAAVLDLPIEQNFGFAYLIPYKNTKLGVTECQFQMGYKGYIQLALRTGLYKRINVIDVREGELKGFNPLTEELNLEFIEDEKIRQKTPVIGYAGYFSLLNGFEKMIYWNLEQLLEHGMNYSAQFRKYKTGMWADRQDDMCRKTVIKNMITKWGILSVEMQQPNLKLMDALQADQAVIVNENEYQYVDVNTDEIVEDIADKTE